MLQRLLRAQHRPGRYHRLAQRIDCFLRGALGAPARHSFADDRSVVAALEIVGETRILQPVILSPINLAQRMNSGCPVTWHSTQPSLVR